MAFITGTFIKVKLACHKMIKEDSDLKNIKGKGLFNHLGFPLDSTLHQENLHCQKRICIVRQFFIW